MDRSSPTRWRSSIRVARESMPATDTRRRAVASGSPREGTMEEHTGTVTEMIEPLATVDLPALSGDERGDPERVTERYGPAYEMLIDAV